MTDPTRTQAWQVLQSCRGEFLDDKFSLGALFDADSSRADSYSINLDGLLLDYSKNLLTEPVRQALLQLAGECGVAEAIEAMFKGEAVNNTEQRPALHVALRDPMVVPGEAASVAAALERMEALVNAIHQGERLGYSGKRLTDVVHIGIGGCELGPALAVDALREFHTGHVNCHFVSNVDPAHIGSVLDKLNGENTLFILASKSGTTLETWENAKAALHWFKHQVQNRQVADDVIAKHFIAITGKPDAEKLYRDAGFPIASEDIFPVWDWVGGRFSLWSAVGLPIALTVGVDNFRELLAGARRMDEHFRIAPLAENMAVMLGLLGVWYGSFLGSANSAVMPYAQRLQLVPAWLQQLSMESLGKRVDRDGKPLGFNTGEVVWGVVGSNVQHSCMQLLHQGTRLVPVDFIAVARPMVGGDAGQHEGSPSSCVSKTEADAGESLHGYTQQLEGQHDHLLANCFSQSLALMRGDAHPDSPHRHLTGNKPSNTLLLEALTPFNLGMLLALYEHKVYVQGVIWNINTFDQWGVELGKRLSGEVHKVLVSNGQSDKASASSAGASAGKTGEIDTSTKALIKQVKHWQSD
ncbi:MAG: glucose-6-phosphate isomerase [Pseudohongiellaceae bacterium]